MCDQQRKEITSLQQQLAAKEVELKKQISELEEKLAAALAASKTGRFILSEVDDCLFYLLPNWSGII